MLALHHIPAALQQRLIATMTDPALTLIVQALNELKLNTLLAIDEHSNVELLYELRDKTIITALTQRLDQYKQLKAAGFKALLSDYDLTISPDDRFDCLAIRIGKQKDITHHLVNQSHNILSGSGKLIIAGAKNEGIKSLSKKLKQERKALSKTRGKAQHEMYVFEHSNTDSPLDDHNYRALRPSPTYDNLQFLSKPGIYGWQKIDKGSVLLIEAIATQGIPSRSKVLDLGCGYGFLSMLAASRYNIEITATDNNIAAIAACNSNFKQLSLKGTAVISDCADSLPQNFDTVLCNPPFHSGFGISNDLTERFIAAAKRCLNKHGKAYFVVNEFIPLEKNTKQFFRNTKLLARAEGFKVFELWNE